MKACLAQLYTVKGNPAANLEKMAAAIDEAAAKGADLVCFYPEKDRETGD